MADKTQELLLENFRSIAAHSKVGPGILPQSSNDYRAGISGADTTIPTTGGLPKPTASNATSSSSGTQAFSLASEVFGSGLGIMSLVTGLMGLFSSGSSKPPPLEKYVVPQRLDFAGAETNSGIAEASYNQVGVPRFAGAVADSGSSPVNSTATNAGGPAKLSSPQINVTVHAMDAQSFMDRSNDIAQAVRSAMLNSSSINDVINDL